MSYFDQITNLLPADLIKFILVVLFSLLIGLEQRNLHIKSANETRFGTDRTYTLIGILGFVLYLFDPVSLIPFLGGGIVIGGLLSVYYYNKLTTQNEAGITSIVVALITYCLAPLIYTQPSWLVLSIVITILVLVEIKDTLFKFSKKIDSSEFTTLAKFLVIAGVILPLLPNEPISENFNISPYNFWMAIVAVSGISYLSYLLRKYVFPDSGIILSGILGGLYSSTATTFILAKKSRDINEDHKVSAAILLATSMMFIRIFILALLFNTTLALSIAPGFAFLTVSSVLISIYFLWLSKKEGIVSSKTIIEMQENPLEFKTALIFGSLFILFAFLTGFVSNHYGTEGIKILSFIVGVTDIDPFLLNIFQGKWNVENSVLTIATINAVTSNNLLKMIYAIILSKQAIRKQVIFGFGILILLGLITSVFYYL